MNSCLSNIGNPSDHKRILGLCAGQRDVLGQRVSGQVVLCYGMDEAQQDQYEAQLKEVFDSFDTSGSGSLGQEELSELCRALHLEEVAPTLLHTLLPEEGLHTDRVHFEQFKDALILVLSATLGGPLSNTVDHPEPDSAEVVPKFVKDGKRYGRRSTPEGGDPTAGSCEVIGTVQALNEPEDSANTSVQNDSEHCSTSVHNSEEYEAEGQFHFWNPDDPGTPRGFAPSPDELEECLQGACEELGLCRDGFASHQELLSVCARLGLEVVEDVFQKLDSDGVMRVQDFVSGIVRSNNPPTPSASTPYRQLKRHHSTQPFDESGRRTTTPSAMTSTISLRLFSTLDDGSGYASAEQLLDTWQEEGIENGPEILQALDFGLERKVNLSELTIALENELLITKNGIHQAVLASFKAEIRYLLECVDRELREKRKVQADLEKADKLKTQMATEVDEHHSAIERLNDYNLRKLEMEHRDKLAAVKSELTRELDHIQQQATRQRAQLEREVEKVKEEEAFLRDRLSLTLKENGRLEGELLENTEKLVESENLVGKLQKNLENILKEKFGDLDPGSAEFFLQEERLRHLRSKYEEQCRELQDRIDELQEELEEYRTLGRTSRPFFKPSLSEEFDSKSPGIESDPGLGSEDCPPFNMSLEAEMLIEQLKDQHVRDLETLRGELDGKVSQYEQQLEELKGAHEQQRRELAQRCQEEKDQVQRRAEELQNLLDAAQTAQEGLEQSHAEERLELERRHAEEVSLARDEVIGVQTRARELEEQLRAAGRERESTARAHAADVAERDRLHSEDRVRLEQQHEAALQGRLEEQRQRLSGALEERERQLAEEWERQRSLMEESHREAVQELSARHSEERERLNGLVEKLKQDFLEERGEAGRLAEENLILKWEISKFKEEGNISQQELKDLNKSQEEMLRKIDQLKKEKTAALTMNESLKNQVLELRSRGQQLEDENGLLSHKSAQNAADVLELNRRLSELLKQREKKASSRRQHHQGELERERAALAAEFAQERSQMAARLSGLEKEMATAQERSAQLEQERALMSQELSTLKEQLCSSRDLRSELASAVSRSEKLQREKETLSEELSRCVDKVAKLGTMENQLSHLRQERQAAEQQAQNLKTQLSASLDKVQALDEALQTVNLQTARLKSDLRVTQQEKEALKQEVMSLHKQLQNANNKNQFLELALHSSGYQSHQKKLYWEELSRLVDQEQQLLRQENDRLQKEVQNTKGDLIFSRDKTRQLESTILSLKQQKQQGQSSLVKAVEQEKLGVKRELDSVRKELLIANRKVSEQSESQREMESLRQENENLKARQARLETQLLEVQLGGVLPREQLIQAQHRLLQLEREGQHRGEELGGRGPDFSLQQEGQEVVLLKMEERMRDVEQKLRNVKLLLQEKVTQLKDQLQKNAKADELIKDLYVENSQLLKALELTEQRQKVAEKKNYLLEEKISSLNKIVRDLSPSPLTAVPYHFSRS
ncbi:ninein isoform X5 [Lepisosteus oculatus]|uniref:ninein isoform X5 n=1 Tax=Lepisosteus oculatus TaxID=7918 RepID=UPI0037129E71